MHRRRRTTTTALVVLAVVLAVALAACGAPTVEPPGPMTVSGTVVTNGSPVLGTGLVFFDAAAVVSGAVAPAAILELDAGVYVGPLTAVDDDQFTIELPDGDDLPAAALAVAASAFYNIDGVPDCDVVADVPTALITEFAVGFGTLPGAYAVSADAGFTLAYVADAAIDFTAPTKSRRRSADAPSSPGSTRVKTCRCRSRGPAVARRPTSASPARSRSWQGGTRWLGSVNANMTLATLRIDDGSTDLVLNVDEAP